MSFRAKPSRAIWHIRQTRKDVYVTVSLNAPITSMPRKKKRPREKMVAGVSLTGQWVSLPPHRAPRDPVAGCCCLRHPTCLPAQSSKPGVFCSNLSKTSHPCASNSRGQSCCLRYLPQQCVPRKRRWIRGAGITRIWTHSD